MSTRSHSPGRSDRQSFEPSNWLRRWWPALVPAGVSLICMVVLGVQQTEIRRLQETVSELSKAMKAETTATPQLPAAESQAETEAKDAEEIQRLKEVARQLSGEISALEKLQGENLKLRAQLSAPAPGLFSPEETEELVKARERAEAIACVNNMKQIGLAARVWAGDNNDLFPPDVVCMSNELSTTKILVCPADRDRTPGADFSTFTMANCSYEWFVNPPGTEADPQRVLTRCPVHGSVGLYDGSVQMRVGKEHPEHLIQRDGKLYYLPPHTPN